MNTITFIRIYYGFKNLLKKKYPIIFLLFYLLGLYIAYYFTYKYIDTFNFFSFKSYVIVLYKILFLIFALYIVIAWLYSLGCPLLAKSIEDGLYRIDLKDSKKGVPLLVNIEKKENFIYYTFYTNCVPAEEFKKKADVLESVLHSNISYIDSRFENKNKIVIIETTDGKYKLSNTYYWNNEYATKEEAKYVLGVSLRGQEFLDWNSTPHIIIAGGTNSGKTVLCKHLIYQGIMKGAKIYICDMKDGLDYQGFWQKNCNLVTDKKSFLDLLEELERIKKERAELFKQLEVANFKEYNNKSDTKLQRIIILLDEASELLSMKGLKGEEKEMTNTILSSVISISRLYRAYGINLICSTQRASAEVLDGDLRDNCSLRIVGRCNSILSKMVIDSTIASEKIKPYDIGIFYTNTDVLFKGYLLDI